jgi:hypothetical protein
LTQELVLHREEVKVEDENALPKDHPAFLTGAKAAHHASETDKQANADKSKKAEEEVVRGEKSLVSRHRYIQALYKVII